MKKVLKSFFLIINYKTVIVTALSVFSTYICYRVGLTAKFPDMLVGVAIVFPVVFSIGSAYSRRETALQKLSDFKGHAAAIYFASRDWSGQQNTDVHIKVRSLVHDMLVLMRAMFKVNEKASWLEYEKKMY